MKNVILLAESIETDLSSSLERDADLVRIEAIKARDVNSFIMKHDVWERKRSAAGAPIPCRLQGLGDTKG